MHVGAPLYIYLKFRLFVQVRTCCNECLAGFVVLVLLEVLDEARCEVRLWCTTLRICVGIAGIKDLRIYAGKFGRNLEVEDRKGLPVGALGIAPSRIASMSTTGIFDRDTFAGTVPTGVHEVSLGT